MSWRALLAAPALASLLAGYSSVHARPFHGRRLGCFYSIDGGLVDGCAVAFANGGNFQVGMAYGQDFRTYATQTVGNGQTWIAAHPQPFDIAGVDYPIGYNPASVLKDPKPSTYTGDGKADDQVQPGCLYVVNGNAFSTGDELICQGYNGGPGITGNWDVEGYDFSLHGCVMLLFSNVGGSITVKNNKWTNGPGCNNAYGYFIKFNGGSSGTGITINSNSFDGMSRPTDTACSGSPCNALSMSPININGAAPGARDFEYNVFLWNSGRPINSSGWVGNATEVVSHNYTEGMGCENANGGTNSHGEMLSEGGAQTVIITSLVQDYNVVLTPANCAYAGNDMTTAFWLAGGLGLPTLGTGGPTVAYAEVNYNTVIVNKNIAAYNPASPALSARVVGTAISTNNHNAVGAFVSYSNYVDLSPPGPGAANFYGTYYCYNQSSGTTIGTSDFGQLANGTANYSLNTGNIVTGWNVGVGQPGCN